MKVKLISDLHVEFTNVKIPYNNEDILIIAGDITPGYNEALKLIKNYLNENLYVKVILVLGNHDYYDSTIEEVDIFWKNINIDRFYFLQNNSVLLNGVRFYGTTLWTDLNNSDTNTMLVSSYYINDFRHIKNFSIYNFVTLHYIAKQLLKQFLEKNNDPVIVITHHLPTFSSIHPKYGSNKVLNYAFACTNMTELINSPNVKIWCHGHTHTSHDYIEVPKIPFESTNLTPTRIICNPRGYTYPSSPAENLEFDKNWTFNIDFFTLVNPCKYSFVDLLKSASEDTNTDVLYAMSQKDRNYKVKELCLKAGWYWKDIIENGILYTSFSPEIKYV